MRVRLYPINVTGCGMYRMLYPAQHSGADCTIDQGLPAHINERDQVVAVDPIDADVVVLQRPSLVVAQAIPYIQAQGITVVVDIDDDVSALSPRHSMQIRMAHHGMGHNTGLRLAAKTADLLTVSSTALAYRYNRAATILPNYIDENLLKIPRKHDGVTIGWGGLAHEHPGDFDRIGTALDIPDTRFLVAGEAPDVYRTQGTESTGPLAFRDYHAQVAHFTIGLAPLADNAFTRAKSWLKPLEYMALGVPCVRSPTPEYDRLGYGFVARSPRHWRKFLHLLLRDVKLREQLSAEARERAKGYTIQHHGWEWAEAWEGARIKSRGSRVA